MRKLVRFSFSHFHGQRRKNCHRSENKEKRKELLVGHNVSRFSRNERFVRLPGTFTNSILYRFGISHASLVFRNPHNVGRSQKTTKITEMVSFEHRNSSCMRSSERDNVSHTFIVFQFTFQSASQWRDEKKQAKRHKQHRQRGKRRFNQMQNGVLHQLSPTTATICIQSINGIAFKRN